MSASLFGQQLVASGFCPRNFAEAQGLPVALYQTTDRQPAPADMATRLDGQPITWAEWHARIGRPAA